MKAHHTQPLPLLSKTYRHNCEGNFKSYLVMIPYPTHTELLQSRRFLN